MLIKLTEGNSGNVLYVNPDAISGFLPAEESLQKKYRGFQTRVYITGEEKPWYVAEPVEVVADKIYSAEAERASIRR